MPEQADDQNAGHRRDQGMVLDPFSVWQDDPRTALQRRLDEISCLVRDTTSGPTQYLQPPIKNDGDRSFVGVWKERSQVLQQQVENLLNPRVSHFVSNAEKRNRTVAEIAESYRGSMAWSVDLKEDPRHLRNINLTRGRVLPHMFKMKSDKCNEFVADVLIEGGHPSPVTIHTNRPASAQEYAKPVQIAGLSDPMPLRMGVRGDIIAQDHGGPDGHVGIIVHPGWTASASLFYRGRIVINNWGYRDAGAASNNGESDGYRSPKPMVRRVLWKASYQQR